jgi:hypothetical protein
MYVMLVGCGKSMKGIIDLYVTRFGVYIILLAACGSDFTCLLNGFILL